MGWCLNKSISLVMSLLGPRRLITFYSTPNGNSAIGLVVKGDLSLEEIDKICEYFPSWVRLEFEFTKGEEYKEALAYSRMTQKVPLTGEKNARIQP